jgi:NAD(P)-dependent dehydrogenase (short-subunit alcohol dehydrogenase family)
MVHVMKNLIITGGASGIGLAIVQQFLTTKNTKNFVIDLDKVACEKLKRRSDINQELIEFHSVNTASWDAVAHLFADFKSRGIIMQYLVNNVADKSKYGLFDENEESWDKTIGVSLTSAFILSQQFIRQIDTHADNRIINIGSVNSKLVSASSPSYHVAKAGLVGLTNYLSVHALKEKLPVSVNCLEPGFIVQNRHLGRFQSEENTTYRDLANFYQPGGVMGSEEDVAKTVNWLCANAPKYLTGQTIQLDGAGRLQEQSWLLNRYNKNNE